MCTVESLVRKLLGIISEPTELCNINPNLHVHFRKTLNDCFEYCTNQDVTKKDKRKSIEIECVLDYLHDELNTGHWSEVPIGTRQSFTSASFFKCVITLKSAEKCSVDVLQAALKAVDRGLLLGAPLIENSELLTECAHYLTEEINKLDRNVINVGIKRKYIEEKDRETYFNVSGKEIDCLERPSLETFNKYYFLPQIPLKLQGCMSHWPACEKWLDVNYFLNVAGERTVPVEIGSHYVDENWTQKLMTLKEFITKHYLSETGDVGYLAQHNLFQQISELQEDIRVPEYCCLSLDYDKSTEPDINAWFGPKNTVSPLHHDPKNNILAQVYGTKQLILFSPEDTTFLYPHEDKLLSNTAQINPLEPDLERFPAFSNAKPFKCLLEPGEMLFIPMKWWHHVTALDKSFSVSFWWE